MVIVRFRERLIALVLAAAAAALVLAAFSASASARVVWLCRPGAHPNPCHVGLSTTIYSPRLRKLRVVHPVLVRHPKIDCFYVYPTVSDQKTVLANRHIDPEERSIARWQAARYSQYCRVFAPMYRQVTLTALNSGTRETPAQLRIPVRDVTQAFETYLHKYSHGRGFVLIGHSQGSFVLEQLIARVIDRRPALRRRLVSAMLLGGNVLVRRGRGVGGTFQRIPACRSDTQLHCVIAFSTFGQTPPPNSVFGRTAVPGEQVLCTNPAALAGGWARIDPVFPSAPFARGTLISVGNALLHITLPTPPTEFVSLPGAYRARCSATGGAHVLEIAPLGGAQMPTPAPTPAWGLHLIDANVAMGNLLTVMRREAAAYTGP
ncbi:MAG TPA: DUF3089 domain-containing protein [Solirubrobacteraceae bacterium]|nr:DUF3089 domain-containing protein [Solirubrobacteraceae bacterium]